MKKTRASPIDIDLRPAKKHAGAAVGAVALAVAATSSPSHGLGVDGTNKSSTAASPYFPANQQTTKRKPRVWFLGHRISVDEGQEELRTPIGPMRTGRQHWKGY